MSDFVQQHAVKCIFNSSDSWIILTPIEQSIKSKIEAIGKPLKEWDIQINYGIKTGYNDAFIISTDKREEILNNCKDDEERARTADLIRPILRGRDIRRYGYTWADLWLINTHNGVKGRIPRVRIEEYPALKAHLDEYWDKISTRADKGETPYNLRNCAYMEDFSKPKIVWAETMRRHRTSVERFPRFSYEDKGYFLDKTCFMAITNVADFIVAFLNSYIGEYLCGKYVSILDNGGYLMQKIYLENIPIPQFDNSVVEKITTLKNTDEEVMETYLAQMIGFTDDEYAYIKVKVGKL